MAGRVHLFDNLKGLLVLLVVLGHYLPQIPQWNVLATCVHELVFLFHMPFFVFLSGLFAPSVMRDGRLRVEKVVSLVALAFLYQASLIAIEGTEKPLVEALVTFSTAPWYLLSLACWYLLVPALERLRPLPCLGVALVVSLAAGCASGIDDVLALNRTLVFLPFFVAGYFCPHERIVEVRQRPWLMWIAVLAGAFAVAWFAAGLADANPFFSFKYVMHVDAYRDGALLGMVERLAGFAGAVLVSLGCLRLVPNRRTVLSTLGERSLQVYVLHRVVRPFVKLTGVFHLPAFHDPVLAVVCAALVSLAVAVACAWKPLGKPFDCLMRARWKGFVRAS